MEKNLCKNTSVTKFCIRDKNLYVKIIWKQNQTDLFHIKIYDGDLTWSGRLSNQFAKKYRERFEETEEQYFNNVIKCLMGQDTSEFVYDFVISEDDRNSAVFTWKKKYEDSQNSLALLVHGSVPVHRDECTESKDVILDFLIAENRDLRTSIQQLSEKNQDIVTDLRRCRTELEKFVDIKTSLETSLYGKFVQLLNAKKRRIQLLEGSINKLNDKGDTQVANEQSKQEST